MLELRPVAYCAPYPCFRHDCCQSPLTSSTDDMTMETVHRIFLSVWLCRGGKVYALRATRYVLPALTQSPRKVYPCRDTFAVSLCKQSGSSLSSLVAMDGNFSGPDVCSFRRSTVCVISEHELHRIRAQLLVLSSYFRWDQCPRHGSICWTENVATSWSGL